jgi:hypothetical protein
MHMNGHPETLVAAHPGNKTATKYGVHSSRFIEPRAAEIALQLTRSFEFSIAQLIAVEQVARLMAILEALDRDLDERGLVDRGGKFHSIQTGPQSSRRLAHRDELRNDLE